MKKFKKPTKKFLIEQYSILEKTIQQIAIEFGYGHGTIYKYLKLYNIKIRSKAETQKGTNNSFYNKKHTEKSKQKNRKSQKLRPVSKKTRQKMSEAQSGENHPLFGKKGKNNPNFGSKCLEITKKRISKKAKERFKNKENHPNYGKPHSEELKSKISLSLGGTGTPYENSDYPAEFNNKLKQKIRERDNYQCQLCKITEEEHIIVFGKVLSVHHKDYDKNNCKEKNLITLCHNCHARTNVNRNYWIEYFNQKLNV